MSKSIRDNACALLSVSAALTAPLLFGLNIGLGGAFKDTMQGKTMKEQVTFTHADKNYMFDNFHSSTFIALMSASAMVGALIGGQLAERLGRKWTIILMAPVYALAWLLTGLATNQYMVLVGRTIAGLALGVNSVAAPVYIAEIAPDHLRGALGACNQLFVCLGIVLPWLFSFFPVELADNSGKPNAKWFRWRFFSFLLLIPTAMMALGMLMAPETPRWLATKGRLSDAKRVLARIRGSKATRTEMEALDNISIESVEASTNSVTLADLKLCAKPLIIALMLQVGQQFSGINGVMNFMSDMYAYAGFNPDPCMVALTMTQLVVTLGACMVMDRFGRRPLLLVGSSGLSLGLAIMAVVMFCIESLNMKSDMLKYTFLGGSLIFMAAFSLGVGAIPWLILGELFDDKVRGTAASIACAVNWTGSFLITISFDLMRDLINIWGTISIYLVFAVLLVVFTAAFVPETKGKSIEEIQAYFQKGAKTSKQQDDVATNA